MTTRAGLPSRLNRESTLDMSELLTGDLSADSGKDGGNVMEDGSAGAGGPEIEGSPVEGGGGEGNGSGVVRRRRGFRPRPLGGSDRLKMSIMMRVGLRRAMERASVELEMNYSQLLEEALIHYLYFQGLSVEGIERPPAVALDVVE